MPYLKAMDLNAFNWAHQCDIIMSESKDTYYVQTLEHDIFSAFSWMCTADSVLVALRPVCSAVAHILYGACTSLSGLQTLGEEYVGIQRVMNGGTAFSVTVANNWQNGLHMAFQIFSSVLDVSVK